MLRFILGWSAWELTASPLWVGIVGALMLAPALVLSPYFGVQSDRVNPRHGLIFSMVFHSSIGLTGAIATFFGAFNELTLLLLAAALGSASALHNPMRLALVPLLVPRSALPSAIGLVAMSFNIARILGPAMCAAIIAQRGVGWAWIVAVCIFATSGAILTTLRGVGTREGRSDKSVNSEFIEGLNYVRNNPVVILILLSTLVNGLLGRSIRSAVDGWGERIGLADRRSRHGRSSRRLINESAGRSCYGPLSPNSSCAVGGNFTPGHSELVGCSDKSRCCRGPYYLYDDDRGYWMSGIDPATH